VTKRDLKRKEGRKGEVVTYNSKLLSWILNQGIGFTLRMIPQGKKTVALWPMNRRLPLVTGEKGRGDGGNQKTVAGKSKWV